MQLKIVVEPPVDALRLYTKSEFNKVRTYTSVPFVVYSDRLKLAKFTQDFESVKYLLIQTLWESKHGQDRFYPVPLLLDNSANLPHYAVDAALRLHEAMKGGSLINLK